SAFLHSSMNPVTGYPSVPPFLGFSSFSASQPSISTQLEYSMYQGPFAGQLVHRAQLPLHPGSSFLPPVTNIPYPQQAPHPAWPFFPPSPCPPHPTTHADHPILHPTHSLPNSQYQPSITIDRPEDLTNPNHSVYQQSPEVPQGQTSKVSYLF